jgi:hypothetical protein
MKLARLEDLECFRQARELTIAVYGAIDESPRWQQDVWLCGQMQSAAGAVMANIAQGFGPAIQQGDQPIFVYRDVVCGGAPKSFIHGCRSGISIQIIV